jgi:hypothetical protein
MQRGDLDPAKSDLPSDVCSTLRPSDSLLLVQFSPGRCGCLRSRYRYRHCVSCLAECLWTPTPATRVRLPVSASACSTFGTARLNERGRRGPPVFDFEPKKCSDPIKYSHIVIYGVNTPKIAPLMLEKTKSPGVSKLNQGLKKRSLCTRVPTSARNEAVWSVACSYDQCSGKINDLGTANQSIRQSSF